MQEWEKDNYGDFVFDAEREAEYEKVLALQALEQMSDDEDVAELAWNVAVVAMHLRQRMQGDE